METVSLAGLQPQAQSARRAMTRSRRTRLQAQGAVNFRKQRTDFNSRGGGGPGRRTSHFAEADRTSNAIACADHLWTARGGEVGAHDGQGGPDRYVVPELEPTRSPPAQPSHRADGSKSNRGLSMPAEFVQVSTRPDRVCLRRRPPRPTRPHGHAGGALRAAYVEGRCFRGLGRVLDRSVGEKFIVGLGIDASASCPRVSLSERSESVQGGNRCCGPDLPLSVETSAMSPHPAPAWTACPRQDSEVSLTLTTPGQPLSTADRRARRSPSSSAGHLRPSPPRQASCANLGVEYQFPASNTTAMKLRYGQVSPHPPTTSPHADTRISAYRTRRCEDVLVATGGRAGGLPLTPIAFVLRSTPRRTRPVRCPQDQGASSAGRPPPKSMVLRWRRLQSRTRVPVYKLSYRWEIWEPSTAACAVGGQIL